MEGCQCACRPVDKISDRDVEINVIHVGNSFDTAKSCRADNRASHTLTKIHINQRDSIKQYIILPFCQIYILVTTADIAPSVRIRGVFEQADAPEFGS